MSTCWFDIEPLSCQGQACIGSLLLADYNGSTIALAQGMEHLQQTNRALYRSAFCNGGIKFTVNVIVRLRLVTRMKGGTICRLGDE